jgi:hypothetical protein
MKMVKSLNRVLRIRIAVTVVKNLKIHRKMMKIGKKKRRRELML